MKVHIIKNGDLLKTAQEGRISAWGHGCNCMAIMGAGISGAVMKMFPGVYLADRNNPSPRHERLGHFSHDIDLATGTIGANLYTQFAPGKDARVSMIKNSIWEFCSFLGDRDPSRHYTFGIPAIGCGIGGLDLSTVVVNLVDINDIKADIDLLLFLRPGEFVEEVYNLKVYAENVHQNDIQVYESFEEYEDELCTRQKSLQ